MAVDQVDFARLRYSLGKKPYTALNMRPKWVISEKPQPHAISLTVRCNCDGSSSARRQQSSRRARTRRMIDVPPSARTALAYRTLTPATAATVSASSAGSVSRASIAARRFFDLTRELVEQGCAYGTTSHSSPPKSESGSNSEERRPSIDFRLAAGFGSADGACRIMSSRPTRRLGEACEEGRP
jgi:hypothetical protein